MSIEYRSIESIDELEKVVDLEIAVWELSPRDATPASLLHAMVNSGSLVVGAFNDTNLVGMAFMFPTSRNNRKLLWSHMAAVSPDFQSNGIGFELKQFQRKWALDNGYDAIGWTFDPLQRGNANFNLHTLGAISQTYHVNFYGDMLDGLNAGLPSDRLEAIWPLRNPRVKQLAQHKHPSTLFSESHTPDENMLLCSVADKPVRQILASTQTIQFIEIPKHINALKSGSKALALEWRIELRNTLQSAFQQGYVARDFVELEGHHYYVLTASQPWYLYVVQCSDQSLYTGITPDVTKRVSLHNNGRGAAYTKTRRPVTLLASWQFVNRQDAMKAEIAFKQLTRQTKLNHIRNHSGFQGAVYVNSDA